MCDQNHECGMVYDWPNKTPSRRNASRTLNYNRRANAPRHTLSLFSLRKGRFYLYDSMLRDSMLRKHPMLENEITETYIAPGQEDILQYLRGESNSFRDTHPYTPRWIAADGSAALIEVCIKLRPYGLPARGKTSSAESLIIPVFVKARLPTPPLSIEALGTRLLCSYQHNLVLMWSNT